MSFRQSFRMTCFKKKRRNTCSFICPTDHVQLCIVYSIRIFQAFVYVSKSVFFPIFQIRTRAWTGSRVSNCFYKSRLMYVFLGLISRRELSLKFSRTVSTNFRGWRVRVVVGEGWRKR